MKKPPFYKSVLYALEGIKTCLQKERNIKIHFFMMICVILCGMFFSIRLIEWFICLILFGLVISLEMINTAIEALADLCSPDFHPLVKIAKDASAGAVLVVAIVSAIIGLIIFIPYLYHFLGF